MNLIIREAKILDSKSNFNNQIVDIYILGDTIEAIGKNLPNINSSEEIKLDNLHVSNGWFDSSVSFGEPGFEDRETIQNGLKVASKSGFTSVALQPNSYPIIDNQSQVNFVKEKSKNNTTDIYPVGALTKGSEGNDLAELFDMKNAGAVAFGDYNKSINNANLLKIALQYTQDFNGLVLAFSQDASIKAQGVVNEGLVSTQLGLKGIPALAEEIIIARNLYILEYTGGKIHFPTISTIKSIELIKQAKANGLQVTCSVAIYSLFLNDEVLKGFDSRYKVLPPLRDENTRLALINAVLDNTIDIITTDHNPIDIENKKIEFDFAKYGTIGLESAFGALNTILPLDVIITKLNSGKEIFNIPSSEINTRQKANLTLFNPEGNWTYTKENILSKSKNSAFLNRELKGKVYGVINNGKIHL